MFFIFEICVGVCLKNLRAISLQRKVVDLPGYDFKNLGEMFILMGGGLSSVEKSIPPKWVRSFPQSDFFDILNPKL